MADVVGTAYVRIKALTDQLAKEIEAGVKRGLKDAKVDRASEDRGNEIGESLGSGIADSTEDTLKKRASRFVPVDDITSQFDEVFNGVRRQVQDLNLEDPFRDKFEGLPFDRLNRQINKNSELSKSLDSLDNRLRNLGRGGDFRLGFLRGALLGIGGAIVASLPFIQDAGSAILAYATGLVAQVGFLTTAVGGLGVAAAAAVGSAATAILPVVLAFKSETEFLVDFKDSIAATGDEFLRIGTATQQTLLPALDEAAFILGDLIPMFSEFGLFVGQIVGSFALYASEVLTSNVAQERLQAILQSSLRILNILAPTLINVGDILSGLWVAALPAAERFADAIRDVTERWALLVRAGVDTGHLTEMFDTWYDRAQLVFGALGNLTGALFDILQVGADESDSLFVRFDEWAERFREFTSSEVGQNRLALIFENSLAVMREVNAIIADIFDGIFGRLAEVGGVDNMVAALQRFRDVIPEIQEFWDEALETIDRVVRLFASNVWEKITQAWDEMGEPLGRLGEQLLNLLEVMNESGAFEVFLDLMKILSDTLATLLAIPGFGQFVSYFLAFGAAAKVTRLALAPFLGVFGGFVRVILDLIRVRAGIALASTATGIGKLAAAIKAATAANAVGAVTGLGSALPAAAAGAKGLAGPLGTVVSGLSKAGPYGIAAAGGVALVGAAFALHQRDAQRWQQEIRQVTDALGTLNGGLNITREGIADYIEEFSRFESRDQLDDLRRMGIDIDLLGGQIAEGTLSLEEFADQAIRSGEITVSASGSLATSYDNTRKSLSDLQEELGLTDSQIESLIDGFTVVTEGGRLVLEGNESLIESFKEVNKAIGAAAKDNIDDFVSNATNIRLLGRSALEEIRSDVEGASDEEAGLVMGEALDRLGAAARRDTADIKGLSDATRDLVREQVAGLRGPERAVVENKLLTAELRKQNRQVRENLDLFASEEFGRQFGPARDAVLDFARLVETTDFSALDPEGNLDKMLDAFPKLGGAAQNLFTQLGQLPEAEFNAAAQRLGIDADVLRGAMEGATQAIVDLQNQALETLPSVGQLLDDATETKEDGSQFFDRDGFVKSIQQRTTDTTNFARNIKDIQARIGDEAARLAAQQGPEAAANLVTMTGNNADQLRASLEAMEASEDALKEQIEKSLGPGIAAEYAVQAELVGSKWGPGLAKGLSSDENMAALVASSTEALNLLETGFRGRFVWKDGTLTFEHTGTFPSRTPRRRTADASRFGFSGGGFVDGAFGSSPGGTDTIPAWLTEGEFVLRRAVAQAIPASTLNALNAGDPRIMGLLAAISQNRPGSAANPIAVATPSSAASVAAGGGISIGQMNIEAPTPLETARQVSSRLSILQTQLTRR